MHDHAKSEAAAQAWQLVSDLQTASRHIPYPSGLKWSLVRVSIHLDPASKDAKETRGILVIKVVLCCCPLPCHHSKQGCLYILMLI